MQVSEIAGMQVRLPIIDTTIAVALTGTEQTFLALPLGYRSHACF
jgi:hypothetical protein